MYNIAKKGLKVKAAQTVAGCLASTLYNAILRTARNFLETKENVKISTHSFYHINLG